MNLIFIDKEFQKIKLREDYVNYKYEPKSVYTKGRKRHTYFKDLESDFQQEINTYGFSPFIKGKILI